MTFFNEEGKNSSTRLIFVIGSFWAMAITTYLAVSQQVAPPVLLAFYSGVQGTLIGLKLGQKQQEANLIKNGK